MTAAAATMPATGESLAARKALRDSRFRGVAFAVFGILAFYYASRSFDTAAKFEFTVADGAQPALLQTTVIVVPSWVAVTAYARNTAAYASW